MPECTDVEALDALLADPDVVVDVEYRGWSDSGIEEWGRLRLTHSGGFEAQWRDDPWAGFPHVPGRRFRIVEAERPKPITLAEWPTRCSFHKSGDVHCVSHGKTACGVLLYTQTYWAKTSETEVTCAKCRQAVGFPVKDEPDIPDLMTGDWSGRVRYGHSSEYVHAWRDHLIRPACGLEGMNSNLGHMDRLPVSAEVDCPLCRKALRLAPLADLAAPEPYIAALIAAFPLADYGCEGCEVRSVEQRGDGKWYVCTLNGMTTSSLSRINEHGVRATLVLAPDGTLVFVDGLHTECRMQQQQGGSWIPRAAGHDGHNYGIAWCPAVAVVMGRKA